MPAMSASDTAYLSPAEARRFAAARGIDGLATATDDALSAALLRGSEWLDSAFQFIGQPAAPDQLRAFPRTGLTAAAGTTAQTPPVIHQAVVELAAALLVSEAEAEQLLGLRGAVAREQVGDVVVSWRARRGAQGRLAHLLRPYLVSGASGAAGSLVVKRS